jgi:hypothetical protein
MCNTQVVTSKSGGGGGEEEAASSTSRLFTFVCTKNTLKEKLMQLRKKKKKKKKKLMDLWWRAVTGGLDATEEFAKRVLLRTVILGTTSKVVELFLLVNAVAMSAHFFSRCLLRPPLYDETEIEITSRVSVVALCWWLFSSFHHFQ